MRKLLGLFFILTALTASAANVPISALPIGTATTTNVNDSFPFVSTPTNVTKRMTIWDIVNIPTIVSTYAPLSAPAFTGNVTATGNITATGTIGGSNFSGTTSGTNTGDVTLSAFGSSPSANGASLSGQALTLQPADGTHPGGVSIAAQTIAGAKTFSTAPILSSLTASLPLQLDASKNITSTAIDLSGSQATGVLAAGRFPALTGDITTSSGALGTTLATVNSNVGSFTNAALTVNGKGLITAASSGTTGNLTDVGTDGIVIGSGTGAVLGSGTTLAQHVADTTHNGYLLSTDWNTFNGKQASGNYITALTGDITASGPGSAATTLATVNTNVGSFTNANITVNAKGLITAAASGSSASGTAPSVQKFTATGTATGYLFTVTSANATVGATYTNNGHTYTVLSTISAGTLLYCSQALAPAASGTLTKATGSGDATITFASSIALATYTTPTSPAPLYLRVRMVGGGGGGAGSGVGGGNAGGTGGITAFGPTLLTANGGIGALGINGPNAGGLGGIATIAAGPLGFANRGNSGGGNYLGSSTSAFGSGGVGGGSPFGGSGQGQLNGNAGTDALANSGSGGGGGGINNASVNETGGGGGSGGYIDAIITSPLSTYVYAIGTAGTAGTAGTSGAAGGAGGSGFIIVEEMYQ